MGDTEIHKLLIRNGIGDKRILDAFRKIPREEFVPEEYRSFANTDTPLPIGYGATISQPYTVAFMTQLLKPDPEDIILEIGTGSGYQSAILSCLVKHVYSIEITKELVDAARHRLRRLGIRNVTVMHGNGYEGVAAFAPYDKIIVTAGAAEFPEKLPQQLKNEGRMIIPVGNKFLQDMLLVTKNDGQITKRRLGKFAFVPLVKGE